MVSNYSELSISLGLLHIGYCLDLGSKSWKRRFIILKNLTLKVQKYIYYILLINYLLRKVRTSTNVKKNTVLVTVLLFTLSNGKSLI